MPLVSLTQLASFLRSADTNSTLFLTSSMFFNEPLDKLSATQTLAPLYARVLARCDPINPAPPATKTLFLSHEIAINIPPVYWYGYRNPGVKFPSLYTHLG